MMYLLVLAGFVLLLGGAELLVRGAVALARRLGVSPLVIGMTVVSIGTSAPELVVCLNAGLSGAPGIAVGNIVGSNIANVLLILGAAAFITPILTKPEALYKDSAVLIGATAVFAGLCLVGEVGRVAGAVLLVGFVAFLVQSYRRERRGGPEADIHLQEVEEIQGLPRSLGLAWVLFLTGLAGIVYGSDLLVGGGIDIARSFGISEEVIGLTLVAVGTSLPELAASAVAAVRGHADVAVGNVIGSNLFNILFIGGTVAVVTPLPVPAQILGFDLWVMAAATVVMVPVLISGRRMTRYEGALFVLVYAGYIAVQAYGVAPFLAHFGLA